VYHNVWTLADGRRAAVFFNPTSEPVPVTISKRHGATENTTVPALSGCVLHMRTPGDQ